MSKWNVPFVGTSLTFNIAETSITFPFQKEQAQQLSNAITNLIQTFAAKQKAERPRRWDIMEYKYRGKHNIKCIYMGSHASSCCQHNCHTFCRR